MPEVTIFPKVVEVVLDKPRSLCFNNRAEYRMQTLERPFLIPDLMNKKHSFAALVAWVWASLVEKDARDFKSPEDLALVMSEHNLDAAFNAFIVTWESATPVEEKAKNV
jgi:hypothetical protein